MTSRTTDPVRCKCGHEGAIRHSPAGEDFYPAFYGNPYDLRPAVFGDAKSSVTFLAPPNSTFSPASQLTWASRALSKR